MFSFFFTWTMFSAMIASAFDTPGADNSRLGYVHISDICHIAVCFA